jgi:hypothetical protein
MPDHRCGVWTRAGHVPSGHVLNGKTAHASEATNISRQTSTAHIWFDNVEIVAARRIGAETVTCVRNIYKYYLAYKLLEQQGRLRGAQTFCPS